MTVRFEVRYAYRETREWIEDIFNIPNFLMAYPDILNHALKPFHSQDIIVEWKIDHDYEFIRFAIVDNSGGPFGTVLNYYEYDIGNKELSCL